MKMYFVICVGLALGTGLVGCGDDGGSGGATPTSSAFQGIHEVESWTLNSDGCDAEGESVLDQRSALILIEGCVLDLGFTSQSYLQAQECNDEAECQEVSCADGSINLSGWAFEGGNDSQGWRGVSSFASGSGEGSCQGHLDTFVLSEGEEEGQLVLETKRVLVDDVGRDADGFCDLDDLEAKAAGQPCAELEVITINRAE